MLFRCPPFRTSTDTFRADKVTLHYVGRLLDGTTFDSSVERSVAGALERRQWINVIYFVIQGLGIRDGNRNGKGYPRVGRRYVYFQAMGCPLPHFS